MPITDPDPKHCFEQSCGSKYIEFESGISGLFWGFKQIFKKLLPNANAMVMKNHFWIGFGSVITDSYPSEQPVTKNLPFFEAQILLTAASLATICFLGSSKNLSRKTLCPGIITIPAAEINLSLIQILLLTKRQRH